YPLERFQVVLDVLKNAGAWQPTERTSNSPVEVPWPARRRLGTRRQRRCVTAVSYVGLVRLRRLRCVFDGLHVGLVGDTPPRLDEVTHRRALWRIEKLGGWRQRHDASTIEQTRRAADVSSVALMVSHEQHRSPLCLCAQKSKYAFGLGIRE